ncbi:hypothetical protein H1R20_g14545, partial [Candolleomyces eurysporus]
MPTIASLTRSLTLPLNRNRSKRHSATVTSSTVTTPIDERPEHQLPSLETVQLSAPTPPAIPRRQNSFLGIKTSTKNNGGIFNVNLDGLLNSKPNNPNIPAYVAPNTASPQDVVFGKPLKESLKYASVQISTANSDGELYVWGYIPVVVAKCGLYLKENATEVPGTFRVNGSNRRMRELQAAFETPPRYGKSLDWKQENYTTHDVASVFRRYLTQMPEPVIPYDLYHQFRDALDLLSVFARKSDKNLMTATNLAVIFRPGLISHPQHEMSPQEHALSQKVLEFLIAHQDWFMLDIPPPPARKGSTQPAPQTQQTQQTVSGHVHERRPSDPQSQPPPTQQFLLSSSPPTPLASPIHEASLQQQYHGQAANISGIVGGSNMGGAQQANPSPNVSSSHGVSARNGSHPNPLPPSFSSAHPPPLSEIGSDATVDDVMVIPRGAAREEFSEIGGDLTRASMLAEDDMSPMTSPDDPILSGTGPIGSHTVTVQRSRTMPSRRKDSDDSTPSVNLIQSSTGKENVGPQSSDGHGKQGKEGKEKRTVLVKKSRRASSAANVAERAREQRTS